VRRQRVVARVHRPVSTSSPPAAPPAALLSACPWLRDETVAGNKGRAVSRRQHRLAAGQRARQESHAQRTTQFGAKLLELRLRRDEPAGGAAAAAAAA
jgi:hypothetical protein